ncbi:MAG: hypothetical protein DME18_13650 [Verrucomicrobia bacterium]|nr:MAG: hypothetical protein DME18_13650 [Verrucomicrobiota bacterium]
MRKFLLLWLTVLSLPSAAGAESGLKRYLYLSTPDGAQEGGSGRGILVFDIDNGHRFVRRIEIPFKEGLRGFCGNAKRHAVYFSTTNRRLGAFDLETEKVLWERQYDLGCDRACITPDGKKLYVPTGWWWKGTNGGFLVVNPDNGELVKRLPAGGAAHNSIASLDGRFVYLGTETNLWVFRTGDDSLLRNINNVGESGVFPFTIDSRNRYAYVCLGKHVGFDVVNLQTGEAPHRVLAGSEPIPHRTHGAALTPDEKELWISDQQGRKLFVFDATQLPPKETGHVDLTQGGHGWVTFSLDGRYAWCHTPDVIDAPARKIVATLKDENGGLVCGSKFIEVHFRDGKVVEVGDQFGLGRAPAKAVSR